MKLSIEEHVVAKVNDDLCINCGRCMLTCNDTGYQAISFSTETHNVRDKRPPSRISSLVSVLPRALLACNAALVSVVLISAA
jgi:dihydropyrimidine dehydrogenase (NADP+)